MTRIRQLFQNELRSLTPKHVELTRRYEIFYHVNDFIGGVTFVVGSVLFFWSSTEYAGTWLFLVGSILFTLRPAINVARDFHLARLPPEDSRWEQATP